LLESELFGHVKGVTGPCAIIRACSRPADQGNAVPGRIGDMPLPLQVKLLRVLQEKQVRPVGATQRSASKCA